MKYNLDTMLLEQTVEVAKQMGGFYYKQLRRALDSAPLEGAGRVEDALNLIGHAEDIFLHYGLRNCFYKVEKSLLNPGIQQHTVNMAKKIFLLIHKTRWSLVLRVTNRESRANQEA